jgi:hypothetical protein
VRLHEKYVGPLSVSDAVRLARELKGEGAAEPDTGSGDTSEVDEEKEG